MSEEIHDNKEQPLNPEAKEMTFMDHLGELRNIIIRILLGVIVGCCLVGYKIDFIINNILIKPALDVKINLQNLKVFGQPLLYFKVIVICGFIISFPYTLYQIWKFIEPALYSTEKKWARRITFYTSFCFIAGVCFAYFIMIPNMLKFTSTMGSNLIQNNYDINEYWSFITMIILTAGIFFEMPVLSFILSSIGFLSPSFLKKYRRHAIVLILILSAILTPSPDPFNQMVLAVPIYILYEISIIVSKVALKGKNN